MSAHCRGGRRGAPSFLQPGPDGLREVIAATAGLLQPGARRAGRGDGAPTRVVSVPTTYCLGRSNAMGIAHGKAMVRANRQRERNRFHRSKPVRHKYRASSQRDRRPHNTRANLVPYATQPGARQHTADTSGGHGRCRIASMRLSKMPAPATDKLPTSFRLARRSQGQQQPARKWRRC